MPQNRYRNRIGNPSDPEGEAFALLSPPPSIVKLVSDNGIEDNKSADSVWKKWINFFVEFVGALSYVQSQFTAPNYTTAQRDALTAVNGMIIYNTTTNVFNFYENGAWVTK